MDDGIWQRVISLGAGVQSTTMALMAARGEIGPMPDCAIFADTQAEPEAVYRHLQWLRDVLPFPVFLVTAGNLRDEILAAMAGVGRPFARPPFFTGGGGMLRRQCTQDYKLIPIQRKCRELIGLKRGQRSPDLLIPPIEQWIGISTDEATRIKPSDKRYIRNRWPLIDLGMSRTDCLDWHRRNGYPLPPKSACTFCPYHSNAIWRDMRDHDPAAWRDAIAVDEAIRPGVPGPRRPEGEAWFVHPDRVPLAVADLTTHEERGQINMFENECAGMCGI